MENVNINQPVNPSVTTPESTLSPINNQKGNFPIILGILVLLLVVGGGAYYLRTQKNNPANQTVNTDTNTQTQVSPTETTTYSSTVLSFKYQSNLTLEERQKNYIVLLSDANNPQSVLISIDARQTGNYANYDKAVSSTKAGLTNVQIDEMTNGVKISGKVGSGYGEGQEITIALFKYGTAAIEAETTTTNAIQLQVFNQILSTLTFK